ncbi:MAG: DUF4833 domain-containing protein [Bacteroidota bacterium]
MKPMILCLFTCCLVPLLSFACHSSGETDPAGQHGYPEPGRSDKLLFFVQRTHNRNTVIYELNPGPDGRPDKHDPLRPCWIRYEEGGVRKTLSFIQNRVYGLDAKPLSPDGFVIHFRAYKKREIYLMKNLKTGKYRAMIHINGKMAELASLFICSVTNALGIPSSVKYIDISGFDPETHEPVRERVIP